MSRKRATKDGSTEVSAKPAAGDTGDAGVHPFAEYLQELIRQYDLKHADLVRPDRLRELGAVPAHALQTDQSHIARLIKLGPNDRPSLSLLSQIIRLFAELADAKARERYSPRDSVLTDVFESWQHFLSHRGDAILYELVRRLAEVKGRPNPALSIVTREDEVQWQRSHVPQERWVITDQLAENLFDDFVDTTCALIRNDKLSRLVYFMPDSEASKKEFKEFQEHSLHSHLNGEGEVFRDKVRFIWVKDYEPVARYRLDDPVLSKSPLRSGVVSIGSVYAPVGYVLTDEAIGAIIKWLHPKLRRAERYHHDY